MSGSPQPIRQIEISVARPFRQEISESWLRKVMKAGLGAALPEDEPAQVSLMVADDATVRELNRKFRGLDEVTDVLSFSASHPGHWAGESPEPEDRFIRFDDSSALPFVLPPGEPPPLGEVIVSFPQTKRQARERNIPVVQELALLIVHGVLHLVGHDHMEPEDTAQMQTKERAALAAVSQIEAKIS